MLDSQEYARYVAWRRRDAVRAFILGEMDRRQAEPWWDKGFDALNTLRQRAQDLSPTEIEALIDESVDAVRQKGWTPCRRKKRQRQYLLGLCLGSQSRLFGESGRSPA